MMVASFRSTNCPMPSSSEQIRLNLARFREELGLKQPEAADRIGVGVDQLRKMEQGKRSVTSAMLKQLADAYGHKVDDFYMEEPPPADPTLLPAFALKTIAPAVDDDLRKKAEEFLNGVNREHLERLRALKQTKRKK